MKIDLLFSVSSTFYYSTFSSQISWILNFIFNWLIVKKKIPKEQSKKTTQRNWQHRDIRGRKTNKTKSTIGFGHHYMPTKTNNVNKICSLLQIHGGKYEPNIVVLYRFVLRFPIPLLVRRFLEVLILQVNWHNLSKILAITWL